MSVKASVSIPEQQDSFARGLVAEGRYSSLSAVVQKGLDLLQSEIESSDVELRALKELLSVRRKGKFMSASESRKMTKAMIETKRTKYGV